MFSKTPPSRFFCHSWFSFFFLRQPFWLRGRIHRVFTKRNENTFLQICNFHIVMIVNCKLQFQGKDTLYSGNYDGVIHIWSLNTNRIQVSLPAHPGQTVLWFDFLDENLFVSQTRDGSMKIWRRSEASLVQDGQYI